MNTDGTFSRTIAIIMPGKRFVAAGKPHQRVIAMPAHRQFHRVGNGIARGQRGPHAFMPHGNAVGHGDGGEFARRATALFHPMLDDLRLTVQRDVAGGGLVPAGRHADPGLVDFLLGDPHRVEIAAVRRARRTFGHMAAGKLRFVETGVVVMAAPCGQSAWHAQGIKARPQGASQMAEGISRR